MLDYFLKHKKIILRSLGAFMIIVGFVVNFWIVPQKGFTEAEIAAANVARMEKSISGGGSSSATKRKSSHSEISKVFKDTQEKQLKYLCIIAMILGVSFLGYSFIKKDS